MTSLILIGISLAICLFFIAVFLYAAFNHVDYRIHGEWYTFVMVTATAAILFYNLFLLIMTMEKFPGALGLLSIIPVIFCFRNEQTIIHKCQTIKRNLNKILEENNDET